MLYLHIWHTYLCFTYNFLCKSCAWRGEKSYKRSAKVSFHVTILESLQIGDILRFWWHYLYNMDDINKIFSGKVAFNVKVSDKCICWSGPKAQTLTSNEIVKEQNQTPPGLLWPKHGPHMVLQICSPWIIINVLREAPYQISQFLVYTIVPFS